MIFRVSFGPTPGMLDPGAEAMRFVEQVTHHARRIDYTVTRNPQTAGQARPEIRLVFGQAPRIEQLRVDVALAVVRLLLCRRLHLFGVGRYPNGAAGAVRTCVWK